MNVLLLEAAEMELDDAVSYHRRIRDTLGIRFERAAHRAIVDIMDHPFMWPRILGEYRRCRLKGFKYGIVYRPNVEKDEVTIVAFTHLSRDPEYWTNRE